MRICSHSIEANYKNIKNISLKVNYDFNEKLQKTCSQRGFKSF